jgi:hypothetical protein
MILETRYTSLCWLFLLLINMITSTTCEGSGVLKRNKQNYIYGKEYHILESDAAALFRHQQL